MDTRYLCWLFEHDRRAAAGNTCNASWRSYGKIKAQIGELAGSRGRILQVDKSRNRTTRRRLGGKKIEKGKPRRGK